MKPRTPALLAITIPALLWLTFGCSSVRSLHPAAAPPPYVELKLDDAWHEEGFIHPGWTQAFDYLNDKKIVATIGIIGEKMQEGSPRIPALNLEQPVHVPNPDSLIAACFTTFHPG